MTKVSFLTTESFLPLAAVSAITRRSIWRGGIGDTAMTHNRYWNERWQILRQPIGDIGLETN